MTVEPAPPGEQAVWDATVAEYHALGFRRAFGAHQRYWICGELDGQRIILGALLFAAAARNVAARDEWLGWIQQQQQRSKEHLSLSNLKLLVVTTMCLPLRLGSAFTSTVGHSRTCVNRPALGFKMEL